LCIPAHVLIHETKTARMKSFNAIAVHPEIQDGEPVFSGTRIRIETFYDFMRIGCSVREFLHEFPSITPDQAMEVYQFVHNDYTLDQIKDLACSTTSDPRLVGLQGRVQASR